MRLNWNNDGIHQYVDVIFEDRSAVDEFTFNMIYELPNGYLKCVREQIEPPIYKYGLSGKRSLKRFVEQHVSYKKMLHIINQVAERLLALSDYLVDIRQVYLSDETIFIDLLTEEVQLLVVPSHQHGDFPSFKQWLLTHIDTYRHNVYYGQQSLALYNYVKSDEFCLSGLTSFIKESANHKVVAVERPVENQQKISKPIINNEKVVKNNPKMSILPYIALALLQVCAAIAYTVLFLVIPKITGDVFVARFGALLILLSVDILITRWLLKQFKFPAFTKNNLFKKLPVENTTIKAEQQDAAETTLLSKTRQEAYLFDVSTNKPYALNAVDTLIGRQQKTVDICLSSRAIGRNHCKIIKRDNVYWITDLASKNGTFVNDIRMTSQDTKQLNSGDKLRLADSEFVFIKNQQKNEVGQAKLRAL